MRGSFREFDLSIPSFIVQNIFRCDHWLSAIAFAWFKCTSCTRLVINLTFRKEQELQKDSFGRCHNSEVNSLISPNTQTHCSRPVNKRSLIDVADYPMNMARNVARQVWNDSYWWESRNEEKDSVSWRFCYSSSRPNFCCSPTLISCLREDSSEGCCRFIFHMIFHSPISKKSPWRLLDVSWKKASRKRSYSGYSKCTINQGTNFSSKQLLRTQFSVHLAPNGSYPSCWTVETPTCSMYTLRSERMVWLVS